MIPNVVVIGLTGAFGSGCSTAARHLRDKHDFHMVKLSDPINTRWKQSKPNEQPKRADLQLLGDEMRKNDGPGVLVSLALAGVNPEVPRIAIDGIRNEGEVAELRDTYGYSFFLMAVLSSEDSRWDRLSSVYYDQGLSEVDFHRDDTRDRDEEISWGQQVELCVAEADVFIDNAEAKLREFKREVSAAAELVTGVAPRSPTEHELMMNMAYGASHASRCLKRHVGAVVVDVNGTVVGTGYNENPRPSRPCAEEPTYEKRCYRDILRGAHFKMLNTIGVECPGCRQRIPEIQKPPWRCPTCAEKGIRTNLEQLFIPDKAMNWCTAIHAEARALDAAGANARRGTLYSTTFPCTQCAERIVEAGVGHVFFTEVYTDLHSAERLKLGNVDVKRFSGVRSGSFERIFAQVRPK